jgi:hypothetical protein
MSLHSIITEKIIIIILLGTTVKTSNLTVTVLFLHPGVLANKMNLQNLTKDDVATTN